MRWKRPGNDERAHWRVVNARGVRFALFVGSDLRLIQYAMAVRVIDKEATGSEVRRSSAAAKRNRVIGGIVRPKAYASPYQRAHWLRLSDGWIAINVPDGEQEKDFGFDEG